MPLENKKSTSSEQQTQQKGKDRTSISREDLGVGQLSSGQESSLRVSNSSSMSQNYTKEKKAMLESRENVNDQQKDEHNSHKIQTYDQGIEDEKQSDFLEDFVISQIEDKYCDILKDILSRSSSAREKFEDLFRYRYGIESQLMKDKRLQSKLDREDGDDLLSLTQKHFNDYGGILHDEENSIYM